MVSTMMNFEIMEFLEDQGYVFIKDEDDFNKSYPEKIPGQYTVRPRNSPEEYPCMARSEDIWYNPNGQDEYILSFIYLPRM